jgi:methyl-accepting chemotaxis protein
MLRFRNIKVGTRLAAAFGVVALLVAAVAGLAVSVASAQQTAARHSRADIATTQAIRDLKFDATSVAVAENSVAYDYSSAADASGDLQGLSDALKAFADGYQVVASQQLGAGDAKLLATARQALNIYAGQSAEINRDFKSATPASLKAANDGVAALKFSSVTNPLSALAASLTKQADGRDASASRSASTNRTTIVALGGLALLLCVGLAVGITRSITRPLDRAVASLDALADGDLTVEMDIDSDDEIGRMAESLGRALVKLRSTMSAITDNSHALASSSEELSAVSTQMVSNADDTATQSNVVSAAAGEVSTNITTVATASEEMTASIREIAKNAADAAAVASEAVHTALETTSTVGRLGESSREIGEVVKVISSIAEQTNLLALNATIEAARAGEAGKGFAVVANEVKELAQETGKATTDISARIANIQGDTTAAVEAIARISETIERINATASTIASAVEEQTATTHEIGRSVNEAAANAQDIARNITGVADGAAQTTAGAGNAQAAASELARMATDLQDLVGQFRY